MTLQDRFDLHTIPEPMSGCLLWLGDINDKGYGRLCLNGRTTKATHVALLLDGRPLPVGHIACHRCDNPGCVNSDHIFHGTNADNMADKMSKGRHRSAGTSKTHCKRGHPLSGENVSFNARGRRNCVQCHRLWRHIARENRAVCVGS